jgi:membrane dipeptidase
MNKLALLLFTAIPLFAQPIDEATRARIERILRQTPLVDGHNDLPWEYAQRVQNQIDRIDIAQDLSSMEKAPHTDIPRLKRGGVGAQFWSVYVPASLAGSDAVRATAEQIDLVHRLNATYPETFELARTAADIERIHRKGKIASLIGMEGGHSIANSLGVLRIFYDAGARYMTLTHSLNNDWADSATDDPKHGGLTSFGRDVVREMNRLGMLVDLSHVSPKTMHDVLDLTAAPPIFSHSSARGVTNHPRNVPDDVLKRLKTTDGVVMVTFVPSFIDEAVRSWEAESDAVEARLKESLVGQPEARASAKAAWLSENPRPRATLSDVADHMDHVRRTAGIEHVGIGSDFDGISSTPDSLSNVADFTNLFAELIRRGYSDDDLKKVAGANVLRVMRKTEDTAKKLRGEMRPIDTVYSAAGE